jgi:hypothetical protein
MLVQKIISRVLNNKKSSKFFLVIIICTIGSSISFYKNMDLLQGSKAFFLDSSLQAAPPWPD